MVWEKETRSNPFIFLIGNGTQAIKTAMFATYAFVAKTMNKKIDKIVCARYASRKGTRAVKSLKYLWAKNNRKPFKARSLFWEDKSGYYECIGFAPIGRRESIGYTEKGIVVGYDRELPIWEEVKSKKEQVGMSQRGMF